MSKPKAKSVVEEFKKADGVFDLDALIKRSNENVVKVQLMGQEYTLKKMTKKVMADFNQVGIELKRVERLLEADPDSYEEDKMSAHELASKQIQIVLGTPDGIFDEVDITDVKKILEFVVEKLGLSGE